MELSHVASSQKLITQALLRSTRTQKGLCKLLLSIPLHCLHLRAGVVQVGNILASVQILTFLNYHCQFKLRQSSISKLIFALGPECLKRALKRSCGMEKF